MTAAPLVVAVSLAPSFPTSAEFTTAAPGATPMAAIVAYHRTMLADIMPHRGGIAPLGAVHAGAIR